MYFPSTRSPIAGTATLIGLNGALRQPVDRAFLEINRLWNGLT
jgi:hypothetical protein